MGEVNKATQPRHTTAWRYPFAMPNNSPNDGNGRTIRKFLFVKLFLCYTFIVVNVMINFLVYLLDRYCRWNVYQGCSWALNTRTYVYCWTEHIWNALHMSNHTLICNSLRKLVSKNINCIIIFFFIHLFHKSRLSTVSKN